jgi:ATP-dependent protease ClpP protease subunit
MIHRVTVKLVEAPAMVMQGVTKNLIMNDARSESIMREHVTLIGEEKWSNLDYYDFYFSGEEAVKMGLAQELGEFSPPTGTPVHFFYPLPGRS